MEAGTVTWSLIHNFGGSPRKDALGFVVQDKVYVGGGSDGAYFTVLAEPWQYDPEADAWIEMPSAGAVNRISGAGFVLGDLFHGLTGYHPGIGEPMYVFNQYSYDPADPADTMLPEFAGIDRSRATGVAIGDRGYLACGQTGHVWEPPVLLNDLWEYDPVNETWSQRASLPSTGRAAAASFVIEEKLYMVGGIVGTDGVTTNESWMYDQATDMWSQVSSIPVAPPYPTMIGTAVASKGYVVAGNSMWVYDPLLDLWQPLTVPPMAFNSSSVAFTIGDKAYFGGGDLPGLGVTAKFFEYSPDQDQITTSAQAVDPVHNGLQVWPNPVQDGRLHFTLRQDLQADQWELVSLDGRMLLASQPSTKTSDTRTILLPPDLARGTYLLRVSGGQERSEQRVVVVQ